MVNKGLKCLLSDDRNNELTPLIGGLDHNLRLSVKTFLSEYDYEINEQDTAIKNLFDERFHQMRLTPNELLTNRTNLDHNEEDMHLHNHKFDPNGTPEFPSRTKRNLVYEIVTSLRESRSEEHMSKNSINTTSDFLIKENELIEINKVIEQKD